MTDSMRTSSSRTGGFNALVEDDVSKSSAYWKPRKVLVLRAGEEAAHTFDVELSRSTSVARTRQHAPPHHHILQSSLTVLLWKARYPTGLVRLRAPHARRRPCCSALGAAASRAASSERLLAATHMPRLALPRRRRSRPLRCHSPRHRRRGGWQRPRGGAAAVACACAHAPELSRLAGRCQCAPTCAAAWGSYPRPPPFARPQ